jgi:hypothetical protein
MLRLVGHFCGAHCKPIREGGFEIEDATDRAIGGGERCLNTVYLIWIRLDTLLGRRTNWSVEAMRLQSRRLGSFALIIA